MPKVSTDPERTPLLSQPLARGVYAHSGPNDYRSPCPLVNCLANHGYINRDGRNIRSDDLNAALNEVGLSTALKAVFSRPIYNEYQDPKNQHLQPRPGFLKRFWRFVCNPWILLSLFGMREPGQTDAQGKPVLNLSQVGIHGVVEHDVSLTRRDTFQKEDNCVPQQVLIDGLLACSQDGKKFTMQDLADYRKLRIQQQLNDNPGLNYGAAQHGLACGEIGLILNVFGDGESVPYEYVRAVFEQERLPVAEGWKKREWWRTYGIWGLLGSVKKVKKLVGLQV